MCVNVDDTWFAKKKVAPPKTLEDLTEPAYKDLFVTPGATTSSPGLAFLLATIGAEGDGWQDYWKKLMANGAKITSGWTDAYEVDFTAGGGKGDRPIVHVVLLLAAVHHPRGRRPKPTTSALLDTCFRQVEYAGVLKGAENPEGMEKFIDFMLGQDVPVGAAGQHVRLPGRPIGRAARRRGRRSPASRRSRNRGRRRDRREPHRVAARVEGHHQPVTTGRHRLVPTAPSDWGPWRSPRSRWPRSPLFFVYPVAGMLARGFWPEGSFDPGAVLEVLGRPRVHRVLWFTIWSAGARDPPLRGRRASRSRSRCTGCGSPAVTCCAPSSWCRSCCRPWSSGSPSGS